LLAERIGSKQNSTRILANGLRLTASGSNAAISRSVLAPYEGKKMKRNNNRRTRLHLECLEDRNLLAGNVNAFTSGGNLIIEGDDASNVITVESFRDGIVQVRGFNDPNGVPTVVNQGANALRLFYGVNGNVVMHMKGGNDLVRVTNLVIGGDLTVDMGPGFDQFATGRDALIGAARFGNTLPGPLYVQDQLIVVTGTENDFVFQSDTHVLGVSKIDLGYGDDVLTIQRPAFSGANVEYFGDLSILPGEGNDALNFTGFISRSVTIDDKLGVLNAQMNSMDVYGTLKFITTNGNDNIRISATNVRGNIEADTEGGNDFFFFFGIAQDVKIHAGLGNDVVQLTSSLIDELVATLESGNDDLELSALTARLISVHGDDGDDLFNIAGVRANEASFFGDKNFDTYREPILPPNEFRKFTRVGFERVQTF
jgi:hypothetical protein